MKIPTVPRTFLSIPRQADYSALASKTSNHLNLRSLKFNSGIAPSDAAFSASNRVLAEHSLPKESISFVISSTQTPDFNNPGLVSALLAKLEIPGIGGLEVKQSTTGSLHALNIADAMIKNKKHECILVTCTEFLSRYFCGFEERRGSLSDSQKNAMDLFGDAAAAFLVVSEDFMLKHGLKNMLEVVALELFSGGDDSAGFTASLPSSSQFPLRLTAEDVEKGRHLPAFDALKFKEGMMPEISSTFLQFTNHKCISLSDVKAVSLHQIENGFTGEILQKLSLESKKSFDVFEELGFTASAGQAAALEKAADALAQSELLLEVAIGAGPSWGFSVLRKN